MRTCALLLALCLAASCKRSEDQAAKQRIFSPEEPVGALASAKEPIDASRLADDPALAQRVLGMPQAEVAARLGAHRSQTKVQFSWFRGQRNPDGGTDVALSEDTSLAQGPGGDFSVRQENDRNQGFELVWVKGEVYVRGLFGSFRKRRTDRTDPERVRELAMGALPTFDRLARGLKLKLVGTATAEGRKLVKYQVAGSAGRPRVAERKDLPKVDFPLLSDGGRGPDPDTARRLEVWEKEEPAQVSGTLLVDDRTGVPVAADLQGTFKVMAAEGNQGPPAQLDLRAVLATTEVGKDPGVKAPQYDAEPSVPHAVKDPLRFLGRQPAAAPGAASTEEPSTEESDEEAAPEEPADAGRR
jgi:hypothetical protein